MGVFRGEDDEDTGPGDHLNAPREASASGSDRAEDGADDAGAPAHHIDVEWLREAYRRTRKDAAAGVDGVTAERYEADLETNLSSLLERFKSGRYRAPAVRRVHLPKPGQEKKTRPIGIPTLEDKILQRAVLMVLEPVYEQDFLDCSYGFRPGRSAHQALQVLWREPMSMGGGWIIDLDIESFSMTWIEGIFGAFWTIGCATE